MGVASHRVFHDICPPIHGVRVHLNRLGETSGLVAAGAAPRLNAALRIPLEVGQCPATAGQRGLKIMGTRLYVGNLPYSADEDQLKTLFSESGRQVTEVRIITDRDTGRPRGFAFVEMASQADADAAVNALNGKEFGGRALTVNEAREQAPRRGGGGRRF